MDIGHAPKESPVLGHGHIDPGTVEDRRAQAAEDGDHDGRRDGGSRHRPEELGGGELADADHPLHPLHRKGQDIDDVDHEIDQGDAQRSDQQAQGDVLFRPLDLLRRAVDRVPAVIGPEDGDQGQPEGREDAGPQGFSARKELSEARDARPFSQDQPEDRDGRHRSQPEKGEDVLDDDPGLDAEVVDGGQEDDRPGGQKLSGGERIGHTEKGHLQDDGLGGQ